jgi:hypothetical protein
MRMPETPADVIPRRWGEEVELCLAWMETVTGETSRTVEDIPADQAVSVSSILVTEGQ